MNQLLAALLVMAASAGPARAQRASLKPIPLEKAVVSDDGTFLACTLQDGRFLDSTVSLVAVGNRILAKDSPLAFQGGKYQYLQYMGWQFEVWVTKQISGWGRKRSVRIKYLDDSIYPRGTVVTRNCR